MRPLREIRLIAHVHAEHRHRAGFGRLAVTLGLVVVYMIAEVIGGLITGSLALLADAGHMARRDASGASET